MTTATDYPRRWLFDKPWKPGSNMASKSMGVGHASAGMCTWAIVSLEPTSHPWLPYPLGDKTLKLLAAQSTVSQDFTWDKVYITSVYPRAGLSGQKNKSRFTIARRREAYERLVSELNMAFGTPTDLEVLEFTRPNRVLAFDTAVADLLAPNFETISEDHGAFFYNPDIHAYVIPVPSLQFSWQSPVRREFVQRDLTRLFTLDDPKSPRWALDEKPKDIEIFAGDTVYFDVETTGVGYFVDTITLLGYWTERMPEDVVRIARTPSKEYLTEFCYKLNTTKRVIGHNLSFDLGMLMTSCGVEPKIDVTDTMVLAFLLGHERKSLKHLTSFLTDRPGSHAFGGFADLGYLAEDVLSTRDVLANLDEPSRQIFARPLMEELLVKFAKMRYHGVCVNHDLLVELEANYAAMLDKTVQALREYQLGDTTNFNATAQLAQFLMANGVKLREKTASGNYSTAEAVLLKIDHPLPKLILEYRAQSKDHQWLVSYLKFSGESPFGRLHPRMNITTARTGRLSCSDPNLQQVPRVGPVKQVFISEFEGGYIGLVDLAQAELRVAALLSEDSAFIDTLEAEDVHRAMASKVFRKPESDISPAERKKSKGVTFGKLYGGSNAGLAARMGVAEEEVAAVERALFEAFPVLAQTLADLQEVGISSGYISTPFGRVRDLRDIIATEGENSAGRKAKNTPIQSVASDIMLVITNKAQAILEEKGARSHIIFGVHDSGLYDIHPDEIELVAEAVSEGFRELQNTPLSTFSSFGRVTFNGELILGQTWAHVEDTNESAAPEFIYACSSHGTGPILKKVTHYRDAGHKQADEELQPLIDELRDEAAGEIAIPTEAEEIEENVETAA